MELAAKRDGTLTGLKLRNLANMGAYLHSASAIPPTFILNMASGCYRIPNVRVETSAIFTNTPSTGRTAGQAAPNRCWPSSAAWIAWRPNWASTRSSCGARTSFNPMNFRTARQPGAEYDSGNYAGALDKALALANYPELVRQRDAARGRGELVGIGVSTFVEPSGSPGGETGLVRVEPNGDVTLVTGSHSHGQGHETSFAQVVADQMNVPMQQVRVVHGDTAAIGTRHWHVRQPQHGPGRRRGRRRGHARGREGAADRREPTRGDPRGRRVGRGWLRGRWRTVEAHHVARGGAVAYAPGSVTGGEKPGLEATELFDTQGEWPFGTHIAVVRIDRETGHVTVEQIVAVDDCGNVVNPLIVEGQVQGGIAQAVGQALTEQVVYDAEGQLLTGSLGDYAVPRATDMPPMRLDHTVTPSPFNPLGAKGVGEAGTNGCPPAIANAVMDALSPLGVQHLDLPFTAERVWQAIQAGSAAG